MPTDTAKLKKHIALMCERLNKGAKLDLHVSAQGDFNSTSEAKKPLETLEESQEDLEDTTGMFIDVMVIYSFIFWLGRLGRCTADLDLQLNCSQMFSTF